MANEQKVNGRISVPQSLLPIFLGATMALTAWSLNRTFINSMKWAVIDSNYITHKDLGELRTWIDSRFDDLAARIGSP